MNPQISELISQALSDVYLAQRAIDSTMVTMREREGAAARIEAARVALAKAAQLIRS